MTIPLKQAGFVDHQRRELLRLGDLPLQRHYCEARKRGVEIRSVEVEVTGEFGGEGRHIGYKA